MTYEVQTRVVSPQHAAVIRLEVDRAEMERCIGPALDRLARKIDVSGAALAGPPFARYAFHDPLVSVECGFPVSRDVADVPGIIPTILPGGAVAVSLHVGPHAEVVKAYDAVQSWVLEQGYEKADRHYERYLTDPRDEPADEDWQVEVVVPYRET